MNITDNNNLILNYFIPFSCGKFVSSCLMFGDNSYEMISYDKLISNLTSQKNTWGEIEYNDLNFWWKPETHIDPSWFHNWYTNPNWRDYLTDNAVNALGENKLIFYTCHGHILLRNMMAHFPNAKILKIIPELDLVKKNYNNKKPPQLSMHFPEYNPEETYKIFKIVKIETPYIFHQSHIYSTELFVPSIMSLASQLGTTLDMDKVLGYRDAYLSNKFNQL